MLVVPAFKDCTLPHFFHITKNSKHTATKLTPRSTEQILYSRHFQRDNETQVTFQEELSNPFALDELSSAL